MPGDLRVLEATGETTRVSQDAAFTQVFSSHPSTLVFQESGT